MKRVVTVCALLVVAATLTFAQTWTPVWKLDVPAYLTKDVITEMGIVKAGFDTDKDGWGEFLCAWTDLDTNAICMYEASADNTYKLVWSWVYPIAANSFAGIAVGDVNNNGVVDIVTTMPSVVGTDVNPPRVWFFEWNGVVGQNDYGFKNTSTGTFDPSGAWNFDLPASYDFRPYSLTIEDIDKDGQNELIVGCRQASTGTKREIVVAYISGDFASFWNSEVEWKFSGDFGGSLYSTTTGDLDKDGNREIYAFIWNKWTLRVFECTGNKQITQVAAIDTLYNSQGIDYGALDAVRVADVNKDGVNEMYIAGTETTNKVFIVSGVTDVSQMTKANVKELYTIPKNAGGKLRSMQIADPEGNGRPNLMIAGETNGQIFSLEYKGSGNPADSVNWELKVIYDIFVESGVPGLSPRLFYGSPAEDMDKDGKDEYVFVNYAPDFGDWADDVPLKVIEISVTSTDVKEQSDVLPSQTRLMQNYPNPFNPSTTIRYELASAADVRLGVFDMLGREVAVLVEGRREAGSYTMTFDAKQLPSGVYFARLQAGQSVQTQRMLLVR